MIMDASGDLLRLRNKADCVCVCVTALSRSINCSSVFRKFSILRENTQFRVTQCFKEHVKGLKR